MNNNLLEIKNLRVSYHSDGQVFHAVNGIDLNVGHGKTVGLVGETGAGKTTTALSVMRLLPERPSEIESGEILFEGKNLLDYTEADMGIIRGEMISMIFQDPMSSLNPVLTVGKQLGEALRLHNHDGLNAKQIEEKVGELLQLVGIPAQRQKEYPHQFSGGMRQRVVIAMALACDPQLLIADEPTTALDVTIQAQVLRLMKGLQEKLGTSMLLITHDLGVVAEMCDEVAVMYAGEIIEKGTAEDIFESEKRHPYTDGLFGSVPQLDDTCDRLKPIMGLMPDPSRLPEGCKFHPRCSRCMEICKTQVPREVRNGTHTVRCHLYANGEDMQ